MRTLFFSVLLFLCALCSAQTVQIKRLDGSILTIPPDVGGTRAAPVSIDVNLNVWSFPGGYVLENPGNGVWEAAPGAPYEFLSLTSDVGVEIKDTDPKRGFATHRFLGGEWWPFLTSFPEPPSPAATDAIMRLLGYRYDFSLLARYPRFDHIMKLFGDAGLPPTCPTGQRDLGWLMRNWKLRTGGRDLVGIYEGTCTQSDGYDNWHYDQLTAIAVNWMRLRRPSDFVLGGRMALAQASWGMYHTGSKWRGYFAYEKSGSDPVSSRYIGAGQIPDWGKQWFMPQVLWWLLLDKHPVLGAAIDDHLALLRRTPANWWGGDWGERRPARYLESLEVAYLLTGEQIYRTKAAAAVVQIWSQLNQARGLWINKGSPTTTSPWMHAELIYHLAVWERLGVSGGNLRAVLDRVLVEGTFTTSNGYPGMWYRFDGPEKARGSAALNGFLLPALAAVRPELHARWADATYGPMLAASWAQIEAGTVVPIQNVGIEFADQGLAGWKKACLELWKGSNR